MIADSQPEGYGPYDSSLPTPLLEDPFQSMYQQQQGVYAQESEWQSQSQQKQHQHQPHQPSNGFGRTPSPEGLSQAELYPDSQYVATQEVGTQVIASGPPPTRK